MWRWLFKRTSPPTGPLPLPTPERVVEAALLVARDLLSDGADQAKLIHDLKSAGFDTGQAYRFTEFLPFAFSRPALEQLGVELPSTIGARGEDGQEAWARFDHQPEYVAGLALARQHLQTHCMPHWAYLAIAESSAEITAVNNALNAGAEVQGAVLSSLLVGTHMADYVVR
jgi:hypothetical protein